VTIRRRVQNDYDLQDAADAQGVSLEDAARDLALLSVMASLTDNFGERIIFKGGAALRFAHGARRTSRDADATVTQPARAPIPTEDVLTAIAGARLGQFLRYTVPKEPATANKYSLDVDQIRFACATVEGTLDVELSFREDVVLEPLSVPIGGPYFDPFHVLTMRPVGMAGEKLRTLAQRQRGTDLSDCVLLEQLANDEVKHLPRVREEKFKLVRDGIGPDELETRISDLRARYEADVRAVDPDAPDYDTAQGAAMRLVRAAWAR
jgi:predicted nucleotidyltransferase component of viral defense system